MKKMIRVVSVLGTPYTIYQGNSVDFPDLADCDGYCDTTIKAIVVLDMTEIEGKPGAKADLTHYQRKVMNCFMLFCLKVDCPLILGERMKKLLIGLQSNSQNWKHCFNRRDVMTF